jgi:hypothetical protein
MKDEIYIKKAIRRIPLHALGFAGPTGTLSYVLWVMGKHHYMLIPCILGCICAFLKELIENWTITQVWPEFWIDSWAQVLGTFIGLLATRLVV